jgi:hypothetical protein
MMYRHSRVEGVSGTNGNHPSLDSISAVVEQPIFGIEWDDDDDSHHLPPPATTTTMIPTMIPTLGPIERSKRAPDMPNKLAINEMFCPGALGLQQQQRLQAVSAAVAQSRATTAIE